MSGIEIIGLISATIGIIDGASKLYSVIANTNHIPEAFREAGNHLPLVRDTLQTITQRFEEHNFDHTAYMAIKPTLKSCADRAERLRDILQEVVAQPDASRTQRYRMAVRRLGSESKVEELAKGMLMDVQLLAVHQSIGGVGRDKVDEQVKVIHALSEVPPSVPDGPAFTHSGTGDQINNSGSGTMNLNKGTGKQYIAHSMTFGSS
ncbi:SesA protein [Dactylonectria estremocensis]|uniref:SesA protein n=1 Tax=Dactylonectria estremocensis TaxID=1079267 RepID=A0A9P9E2K8_9HYPO|nr:SesA protein [Dactylonectria estremocensis]